MIPLCKMIECKFVIEEYDGLGCCLNENTSFTYSNISDYGRDAINGKLPLYNEKLKKVCPNYEMFQNIVKMEQI